MHRLATRTVENVFVRQLVNAQFATVRKPRNVLYAVLTGAGLGTSYAVWQARPRPLPDLSDLTFSQSLLKRDLSTYTQHVDNALDSVKRNDSYGRLTLYQFYSCPFCCKVRAYLDYFGIDYDIVEVNSVSKSQLKWSDYKKVPILILEDKSTQLNDSNVIISALEARRRNQNVAIADILPVYGPSISQNKRKTIFKYDNVYTIPGSEVDSDELRMREWIDTQLIPVAGLSIYDTLPEAVRSFKWFSQAGKWRDSFGATSNFLTIYSGAFVMYLISKLRRRSGGKPTLDDVVAQLATELSTSPNKNFLGGSEPNIADVCAYGALTALSGCDKFVVITGNDAVAQWWGKMSECVQNHDGARHPSESTWSSIQSSVLPVLCVFLVAKLVGVHLIYDHVV